MIPDSLYISHVSGPWWHHKMETFSALLALCAGNSPVPGESPHKSQWRGALMFSLIYAGINCWVNKREAGELRCHRARYDVTVMLWLEGWMLGLSKHAILLKTGWYLIPMFITIGQATWNVITQYEFLAIFVCSLPCNTWIQLYTLNTESCYYVDFVVIGGTAGCHYDNLQCHQWWQSWHHENS